MRLSDTKPVKDCGLAAGYNESGEGGVGRGREGAKLFLFFFQLPFCPYSYSHCY